MEIISFFAGAAAQTRFTSVDGGWNDDYKRASDFAAQLLGEDTNRKGRLLRLCYRLAERLVDLAGSDVQRVAAELLKEETLSRQQVLVVTREPIYKPRFDYNALLERARAIIAEGN
jgi:hypothetical protein